jgi:Rod binding domain-containing protein
MTDIVASSALSGLADLAPSKSSPAKIHQAAVQFESMLIDQVLKLAREAGGSSFTGTEDDEAGETGYELGEQEFSKMLASAGGLGLAPMIEKGLQRNSEAAGQ